MNLGLIALGVGIGFLIHWLVPAIDLGMGILIAVITMGFSIHYFVRLIQFGEVLELPRFDEEDLPPIRAYPLGAPRSARKRNRKAP